MLGHQWVGRGGKAGIYIVVFILISFQIQNVNAIDILENGTWEGEIFLDQKEGIDIVHSPGNITSFVYSSDNIGNIEWYNVSSPNQLDSIEFSSPSFSKNVGFSLRSFDLIAINHDPILHAGFVTQTDGTVRLLIINPINGTLRVFPESYDMLSPSVVLFPVSTDDAYVRGIVYVNSTVSGQYLAYRRITESGLGNEQFITILPDVSKVDVAYSYIHSTWWLMYETNLGLEIQTSTDRTTWTSSFFKSGLQVIDLQLVEDTVLAIVKDGTSYKQMEYVENWSELKTIELPRNGINSVAIVITDVSWYFIALTDDGIFIYYKPMGIWENQLEPTGVITSSVGPVSRNLTTSIFILVSLLILSTLAYSIFKMKRKQPSKGYYIQKNPNTKFKTPASQITKDTTDVPTQYIPELGRNIRQCCFQTARIGDRYCWCGRAVEKDVMEFVNSV